MERMVEASCCKRDTVHHEHCNVRSRRDLPEVMMSTVPGTRHGAVLPVRLVSTDRIECTLAVSSSASSRHISSACTVISQNRRTKKMNNYTIYRESVTLQRVLACRNVVESEYGVHNMVDNIRGDRQ
jgi:hypothetical protein